MKLEKEDYIDPRCVLCGKPGEEESVQHAPRIHIIFPIQIHPDPQPPLLYHPVCKEVLILNSEFLILNLI